MRNILFPNLIIKNQENTNSINGNDMQKEIRRTLDMLIQKYELIRGHFYILQTHHEL